MKELQRYLLASIVGLLAALVGVLNIRRFYLEGIQDSTSVLVVFWEVLMGAGIAVALVVAAWGIGSRIEAADVSRIGYWFLLTGGILGGGTALMLLSQMIQSEYTPSLLFTNILGIGALGGIAVGYYDVIRRRQSRTIERERDQFEALFRNVPTAVVAVSMHCDQVQVEMVNPAFERVFGFDSDDLEGMDVRDVLRPPGETPEQVRASSLTGLPEDRGGSWHEVQVTLETRYGRREFVRISAPVDAEDGGPEEYAFYIDVTDQIQREERVQVLSRTLRHDLRNRLNVITGSTRMLIEEADLDADHPIARRAESAAEDLLSISDQTRTVESLASGQYARREMSLAPLLDRALETVAESYDTDCVSMHLSSEYRIIGDDLLAIAFECLIENAIRHNDAGQPTVSIEVAGKRADRYVTVSIRDNGPGIPSEVCNVILGTEQPDAVTHSTGIGLWVANWILRNLGGDITIPSTGDEGTEIQILVPNATWNPDDSRSHVSDVPPTST